MPYQRPYIDIFHR